MNKPSPAVICLTSLVVACGALAARRPALAYVSSITNETQTPLRWMSSSCVFVRPNAAGSDDITDGSDLEAISRSIDNWHQPTEDCSYLRFELLDATDDAAFGFDEHGPNENVIAWVEEKWSHDRQAAGITTVFFIDKKDSSQDGRILDADIELNGEFFRYATSGDRTRTDIENTVTHELGHVLGLDHPCDDGTRNPLPQDHEGRDLPKCYPLLKLPQWMRDVTMFNFADAGETKKRSLEPDDVLGICETYPKDRDPGRCEPVDMTRGGCALASQTHGSLSPVWVGVLLALLVLAVAQRRR